MYKGKKRRLDDANSAAKCFKGISAVIAVPRQPMPLLFVLFVVETDPLIQYSVPTAVFPMVVLWRCVLMR